MEDFNMWKEFKAFILKGNVIDLAVAVVIGINNRQRQIKRYLSYPGTPSHKNLREIVFLKTKSGDHPLS